MYDVYIGTIQWPFTTDQGDVDIVEIPNSCYVPEAKHRLISPQHWSQQLEKQYPNASQEPGCYTTAHKCVLSWGEYTKTVYPNAQNVFDVYLADGFEAYEAFCVEHGVDTYDQDIAPDSLAFCCNVCERDDCACTQGHKTATIMPAETWNRRFKRLKEKDIVRVPEGDKGQSTVKISEGDKGQEIAPAAEGALRKGKPEGGESPYSGTPLLSEQGKEEQPTTALSHEGSQSDFDLDLRTAKDQEPLTSAATLDSVLEDPTAELLRQHYKFGHVSFRRLQEMAKQGILPKRLASCPIPVCSACLYGKGTKRAKQTKSKKQISPTKTIERIGQCVSCDVLTSPVPGLIGQMAGFLTKQRYNHALVFVDHYSDFGYVHLLKTQTAEEVLLGKAAFEAYAESHGIAIQHYHADNGIFAARAWVQACHDSHQGMTYAGVNAHFQNGRAEKRIRDLQDMARCMLIHGHHRWQTAITANLWPWAIRRACEVLNATPNKRLGYKSSPAQVFSRADIDINPKQWVPLFCPVYVLARPLQQDKPHPKWKERMTPGIYLGTSPSHARSVALVLNLTTGRVSPQYHVVFDPMFTTVSGKDGSNPPESMWQGACHFGKRKKASPSELYQSQEPQFIDPSDTPEQARQQLIDGQAPIDQDANWLGDGSPDAAQPAYESLPQSTGDVGSPTQVTTEGVPLLEEGTPTGLGDATQQTPRSGASPRQPTSTTRPRRSQEATKRRLFMHEYSGMGSKKEAVPGEILAMGTVLQTQERAILMACAATADPDTMYFHQAMSEPDSEFFLKAAAREFASLLENGVFEFIPASQVPKGMTIFPSVWAMKRKRKVRSREVYKYKARLTLDGSKQRPGQHYEQTYAPVASWEMIRLLLATVLRNKWKTIQLDYVAAFPQAPVERECYMKVPKGIKVSEPGDWVLKVRKNVYGQKQAGRVWNQYLVEKLTSPEVGFRQSKYDECVFYKGKAVYMLYTDDSILAGPDEAELRDIVESIRSTGLDITEEGDLEDFLGVNIDKVDEETYHLSQPQLIDSVLKDLRLDGDNVSTRKTPAMSTKVIGSYPDSPAFDQHFHYRSVIGKLNYLEKEY